MEVVIIRTSVEVLVRLAKAFDVSVDFLFGEGANAPYYKDMIKRLEEVEIYLL